MLFLIEESLRNKSYAQDITGWLTGCTGFLKTPKKMTVEQRLDVWTLEFWRYWRYLEILECAALEKKSHQLDCKHAPGPVHPCPYLGTANRAKVFRCLKFSQFAYVCIDLPVFASLLMVLRCLRNSRIVTSSKHSLLRSGNSIFPLFQQDLRNFCTSGWFWISQAVWSSWRPMLGSANGLAMSKTMQNSKISKALQLHQSAWWR